MGYLYSFINALKKGMTRQGLVFKPLELPPPPDTDFWKKYEIFDAPKNISFAHINTFVQKLIGGEETLFAHCITFKYTVKHYLFITKFFRRVLIKRGDIFLSHSTNEQYPMATNTK